MLYAEHRALMYQPSDFHERVVLPWAAGTGRAGELAAAIKELEAFDDSELPAAQIRDLLRGDEALMAAVLRDIEAADGSTTLTQRQVDALVAAAHASDGRMTRGSSVKGRRRIEADSDRSSVTISRLP